MQALKVTLVQTGLHWEDPARNRRELETRMQGLRGGTDMIVLPEMFTTGFSMNAGELAEPPDGPSMQWMRMRAAELDAAVCGSLIIEEQGRFFNRFVWMPPDGAALFYDKRHLFRMAGEHEVYSPGNRRIIFEYRGWRICPMVCYDLRFPVWSRGLDEFDLLVYVANWPTPRANAWRLLLQARAIENASFVAGVNRTGTDGNGKEYAGESCVVDYLGKERIAARSGEHVSTTALDGDGLMEFRHRFPVHLDADHFELIDP